MLLEEVSKEITAKPRCIVYQGSRRSQLYNRELVIAGLRFYVIYFALKLLITTNFEGNCFII